MERSQSTWHAGYKTPDSITQDADELSSAARGKFSVAAALNGACPCCNSSHRRPNNSKAKTLRTHRNHRARGRALAWKTFVKFWEFK